jgi:hypothetical protein
MAAVQRLLFIRHDDHLTGGAIFPAAVIINSLLKRDDCSPRQNLGHDQASKKEEKQVPPDKGIKLSHTHFENDVHAAALSKTPSATTVIQTEKCWVLS